VTLKLNSPLSWARPDAFRFHRLSATMGGLWRHPAINIVSSLSLGAAVKDPSA
jgi:hypothetical protein